MPDRAKPSRRRQPGRKIKPTNAEKALRKAGGVERVQLALPWQNRFLAVLRRTGNVSWAARSAGVSRQRCYEVRDLEPMFAACWDDALDDRYDLLEAKLLERATFGWEEPVFGSLPGEHAGSGEVGRKRKFDNRLGTRILEAKRKDYNRSRGDYDEGTDDLRDAASRLREFVAAAFQTVPGSKESEDPNWGAQRMGDAVVGKASGAVPGEVKMTSAPPRVRLCVDCGAMLESGTVCAKCEPPEQP